VARKKSVRRQLERQAHRYDATREKHPPQKKIVVQVPSSFSHSYGPGILAVHGPLILAFWSVPFQIEAALKAAGKPVPPPVRGVLLLDTGATGTCISIAAATKLGLRPIRLANGYGAGGKTSNPVFVARLSIAISNAQGIASELGVQQEVQGIPALDRFFDGRPLHFAGAPVELIGLLGRDILAYSRFQYDGLAGMLRIEFDYGAMGLAQKMTVPVDAPAGTVLEIPPVVAPPTPSLPAPAPALTGDGPAGADSKPGSEPDE
jgi:hypothetical protein